MRHPLYLAVYDLTCDKERARLAKVLEGLGLRVQKSAFELRLSQALRERLRRSVRELHLRSGFVLLYRIDERCPREAGGVMPPPLFAESDHSFLA